MIERNTISFRPANYRPEIDGLRATAVLSVVGFHAFPTLLPGGFIGVDVFFVISGYLISSIIFKGVDQGRFSYSVFYAHRIRRIFPALALVLGTCLFSGAWLLFPGTASKLGLHTAAAAAFSSNILLWTESGYFDADSGMKPLLHMWSLGIEEQFYVVWPLILGACGRHLRLRLAVLLSLVLASFVLGLALLNGQPVSAFYLPFSRFWELLIGAVLAFLTLYGHPPGDLTTTTAGLVLRHWQRELLACVGALLLIVGLATLRATQPFPGWRALLPTLGAAFLISGGPGAWVNRRILSTRVAIFFGSISYPLYLWHWPLLTFPNILNGGVPRNVRIAAVLVSVALAWITYRFVESPIRSGAGGRRTTISLALIVGLIGACGLGLYVSNGFPQRYPAALRSVAVADQTFDYAAYRERECFLMAEQNQASLSDACVQPESPGHDKLLVLWGDSHAASMYPGLKAILAADGSPYRLAQFNASACPPVLGFSVTTRPYCRATNDLVFHFMESHRPDTVVMLASWPFYNGQGEFDRLEMVDIVHTVERLHALGIPKIVVLGPLPRWLDHEPNVVLKEWNRHHSIVERSQVDLDPNTPSVDERLKLALVGSPATFVSMIQLLCTVDGCQLLAHRGDQQFPMAWDDAHLTVEGSETVARMLLPLISR